MPKPYEGAQSYIFVSYSHKDASQVMPAVNELAKRGYRVWYDDGIRAGEDWPEIIAEHLLKSALFVAFVTDNYVASKNCRRELTLAVDSELNMFAVFLAPTQLTPGVRMQLATVQSVLRYNYPTTEQFCAKLIENPAMADPKLKMSVQELNELRGDSVASDTLVSELTVAIGICKHRGCLLMVKRANKEGNLLWQFPAAIVKPSEAAEVKILREVLQETGVKVASAVELGARIHPDTKVLARYFAVEYLSGEPFNGDDYENEEARWIGIEQYREYITSDLYEKVVRYIEREQEPRPEVVMSIVTSGNRVLLVHRAKSEGTLSWQFPGGTVEQGESVEQTALRELREETGVNGRFVKTIGQRLHPYTKKQIAYTACEYVSGGIAVGDDDLDRAEWVDISRINEYFGSPLYSPVEQYLNGLI